ncbi:Rhodanese-related sulfurtransferase [Marinospirillum celere]|uniref:Rhodanese-related sulfurtransferase n=1 Tax=Marinospirillum celere TaxID=1122252 RepID=A0A1I1FIK4_9GAMM|nr:rhodanese-like domain-containing protein [Marinospirillum celere]SFB98822.1 Rhodanese-related sulfurtransferase [Marinospirillum celere]
MRLILAVVFVGFFALQAKAEVTSIYPDQAFLDSGVALVDIRTSSEWQETGLAEGALPLTFFDEQGQYDARTFLEQLEKHVSKEEPLAIICRSGNRTSAISDFLSQQGYQVINLEGGMNHLLAQGYQPVPLETRLAELKAAGSCVPDLQGC